MLSSRKTVDDQRTVTIEVPFQPGTELEVVPVSTGIGFYVIYFHDPRAPEPTPVDLRRTVKAYHEPFRSVAEEDWEALK